MTPSAPAIRTHAPLQTTLPRRFPLLLLALTLPPVVATAVPGRAACRAGSTRSRPCRVRVIFRPLSQAAWIVRISRSSVLDRGFQDLLQPCCLDRKHTCPPCITIILFANSLPRVGLWPRRHAEQEHFLSRPHVIGQSRRHRAASTASTFADPRPWVGSKLQQLAQARVARRSCGRRGTTLADAASRPRPGTAC